MNVNVTHPKDARTEPLCIICGQPEVGHPKGHTNFHEFTPNALEAPEQAGQPNPGQTPTPGQNPPTVPPGQPTVPTAPLGEPTPPPPPPATPPPTAPSGTPS